MRALPIPFLTALLLAASLGAGLGLTACGGGGGGKGTGPPPPPGGVCADGGGPPVTVTALVSYERLLLTPLGLGPALVLRPARFVDVEVRGAGGGPCYGAGSTDASGNASVVATPPAGAQVELWALSRTDEDPLRRVTVHDALPPSSNVHTNANVFGHASAPFTAGSPGTVNLTVPYGGGASRPSIGFGLLDVLLTCSESVRTATGVVAPLCHAYVRLGNNGALGTSFYDHGARAIAILGGASGNLDGSDTDYFDDGVIAHEYLHFLEFNLGHSLNRGGAHGGERLEPNFAWSEGQATGFGGLLRGDASYVDSTGTSGGVLISASVENWPQSVRGIGGEETVAEIVWDLGDGTGGVPNLDGDGVAVGLGDLLGVLLGFSPQTDAPYVGLFLDRLVAAGAATVAEVATLMLAPENQQISYPLLGSDVWPVPLAVPGSASGTADSLSGPNKNPCRGLTSSVWYGFTLATSRTLTFDLTITPIAGSGDDLDLFLLRVSGTQLASSTNSGANPEKIGPILLGAGTYLVRVEADCGGAGNRANFDLAVTE